MFAFIPNVPIRYLRPTPQQNHNTIQTSLVKICISLKVIKPTERKGPQTPVVHERLEKARDCQKYNLLGLAAIFKRASSCKASIGTARYGNAL
ncbi:hypothetical protein C8J56DRAFT_1046502 [Mycena floridula]|nr:hypothetical protein C8J56DRAFT_1046502 [Mycena floridula]